MAFAPGCVLWPNVGGVFLGRKFEKSKKMRDRGVLANLAIAQLYRHFGSRSLEQNIVLCLHFKCIFIKR